MEPFTQETLQALYDVVSHSDGVSVAELRSLAAEFTTRPLAAADLKAFREGKKPWKKLRDEVLPVERFLSFEYPDDTEVRFPLDDQPPDAWVRAEVGEIGVEVTGALARAGIEVGKSLAYGTPVPGFIALPDDATQQAFDAVRARGRMMNARKSVDQAIDQAIAARMASKDKDKFAGQILLITAPIGSSPNRSDEELRQAHAQAAAALPFTKVYVMDGSRNLPIIRLK